MSPAPNASVSVIDHAVTSASTVPITRPSIATNADSTTNAARTDRGLHAQRAQHADLATPLAHGAHHDHADAGDADDQPEREIAADEHEELLLVGELVVHGVANRLRAAAVGEEAAPRTSSTN